MTTIELLLSLLVFHLLSLPFFYYTCIVGVRRVYGKLLATLCTINMNPETNEYVNKLKIDSTASHLSLIKSSYVYIHIPLLNIWYYFVTISHLKDIRINTDNLINAYHQDIQNSADSIVLDIFTDIRNDMSNLLHENRRSRPWVNTWGRKYY
jgi:hypothetical protein